MKLENLLIICNNYTDLIKIENINFKKYSKIILATDDLLIHEKYEKGEISFINNITFIQKSIPYTNVAYDVIKIIDKINEYLRDISKQGIFTNDILKWHYHVEGGDTTQRVQDILLYIDNIYKILKTFNITTTIFINKPLTMSENIFYDTCLSNKIIVKVLNKKFFIINKNILKLTFRNILKAFYFPILKIYIKLKYLNYEKEFENEKNIVLFQLCNNAQKHINNITFTFNEFIAKGYSPITITWNGYNSTKSIQEMGYDVLPLEVLLSWKEIFTSIFKTSQILFYKTRIKKIFFNKHKILYKNININKFIFSGIIRYLYTDAPDNYLLKSASDKISFKKNIVAVKYCSAYHTKIGTIVANSLGSVYIKFNYHVGALLPSIYGQFDHKKYKEFFDSNFITFLPNIIEKGYLIKDTDCNPDSIVIMGSGKSSTHFEDNKRLTKQNSFKNLNIKDNFSYYIIVDYPSELFGYHSKEEIYITFKVLFKFIKNRKDIALLIKPHPSSKIEVMQSLLKSNLLKNIILLNKNSSISDLLNISDVLITKYSTLGIEAMIYDVQVISCLFDREKLFKIYDNSAEYIYAESEFEVLLNKVFKNKKSFDLWKNDYFVKRKSFISNYYPKLNNNSDIIIVNTVNNKLKGFK